MLVLTRKKDQSIVIPGLGVINVLSVNGKRVRLGLDFNDDIEIQRGELPTPDTEHAEIPPPEPVVMKSLTT
jgi:carbon storage regulator CsrA